MYIYPSEETVQRLREQYPDGTRVEFVSLDFHQKKLKPGDKGTVDSISNEGTLNISWDNGVEARFAYQIEQYWKINKIDPAAEREEASAEGETPIDKPAIEQSQLPPAQTGGRSLPDAPKDKQSVLNEIHESRSESKQSDKTKPERDKVKKKNQPEH